MKNTYGLLKVEYEDIMMLTMALANDPNRPTLTQEDQGKVKRYLELTARLQQMRRVLTPENVENDGKARKQTI